MFSYIYIYIYIYIYNFVNVLTTNTLFYKAKMVRAKSNH